MLGSAAIAAIVLPVLQACEPSSLPTAPTGDPNIDVSDLSESNPVKQAPGLSGSDGKGILISRQSDTEYYALSMECTHSGCNVETVVSNGTIPCLCHGSEFHLDGTVKRGPAASPLARYATEYDATTKIVTVLFS